MKGTFNPLHPNINMHTVPCIFPKLLTRKMKEKMSTEVFGTKLGVFWEMAVKVCSHTSFFSLVTYFHRL